MVFFFNPHLFKMGNSRFNCSHKPSMGKDLFNNNAINVFVVKTHLWEKVNNHQIDLYIAIISLPCH